MQTIDLINNILIPAIMGSGAAVIVIAFLSKRIIEHRLAKDSEKFRSQLSERAETLKVELSIYAHEQTVVLSRIDAQRADAIKRLYTSLLAWGRPISKLVAGSPHMGVSDDTHFDFYRTQAELAHAASLALADQLVADAIYFDSALYEQANEVVSTAMSATAKLLRPIRLGVAQGAEWNDMYKQLEKDRATLVALHSQRMKPLQQRLVDVFREALGSMRSRPSN